MKSEMRTSEARSRSAWRTYDGFIYPGFKSSIESNEHPGHPDEARVEALRKVMSPPGAELHHPQSQVSPKSQQSENAIFYGHSSALGQRDWVFSGVYFWASLP